MSQRNSVSTCELPAKKGKTRADRNRIYKFRKDYTWQGVKVKQYKSKGNHWSNIVRHVLIGEECETLKFHLRYFEVLPGGFSSFETHKHEHVVIGIRGKGMARLDRRRFEVNFLDVIYIKPGSPHQLYNPYNEPFGFFCIVNARRDRPKLLKM